MAALPPEMLLCVAVDITGPSESIITMPLSGWKRALADGSAPLGKIPAIFLLFS